MISVNFSDMSSSLPPSTGVTFRVCLLLLEPEGFVAGATTTIGFALPKSSTKFYKLSLDGTSWGGLAWDRTTGVRFKPSGLMRLTIQDGG